MDAPQVALESELPDGVCETVSHVVDSLVPRAWRRSAVNRRRLFPGRWAWRGYIRRCPVLRTWGRRSAIYRNGNFLVSPKCRGNGRQRGRNEQKYPAQSPPPRRRGRASIDCIGLLWILPRTLQRRPSIDGSGLARCWRRTREFFLPHTLGSFAAEAAEIFFVAGRSRKRRVIGLHGTSVYTRWRRHRPGRINPSARTVCLSAKLK
jgi:hypothetical protein